jgi:hypothetical protein
VSDILSIIQSNYLSVGSTPASSNSKYVAVDPKSYQGNWSGQYGDGGKFSVAISNVSGFKAKVRYQSGANIAYSQVLIKDSSFHIGDSKFSLVGAGKAVMATAITDPVSGNVTVQQGNATLATVAGAAKS